MTFTPISGQRRLLEKSIKDGGVAGVPTSYYRKALDLNRFSNSVANKLLESYRRQIIKGVRELERIDKMPSSKKPEFKAARTRALIQQNLESMRSWSKQSVNELVKQLDGLADVEVSFAQNELMRAMPAEFKSSVRSVEVTEAFAESVVKADPLDVGTNLLRQNIEEAVKGPGSILKLTARQGAIIRMPDGSSVVKSFRGLAERQGELFSRAVLDGLLTGEGTEAISRSLFGELGFSTEALTSRQVALAQTGNAWKMAKHQVRTLVRTSVNATSNAASQAVYKANPKITKKYRWLATLDSRTTAICRNLDQNVYEYGKGPTPESPPHFNCRSTTIAVIDYEGLGIPPPPNTRGYRPTKESNPNSADPDGGRVPVNVSAAQHIYDLRGNTKSGGKARFEPSAAQARMLNGGKDTPGARQKARYYNRLADKYGPDGAMKRFMQQDGSEVSLKQLKQRYGDPDKIERAAAKPKAKPKPKVQTKTQDLRDELARAKAKTAATKTAADKAKAEAERTRRELQRQKPFKDQFVDSPEVAEYMDQVGGTGATFDRVLTALSDDPLRKQNIERYKSFVRKNNVIQNYTFSDEKIRKNSKVLQSYKGAKIQAMAASQRAKIESLKKQGYSSPEMEWAEYMLERLDAGDIKVLPTLIAPHKGANGYTRQSQGIVNISMRRNSALGKKKDLLNAAEKTLDRSLDYVKTGKGQLPFSNSAAVNEQQRWISTSLHEVGHQVHYFGIKGGAFSGSQFQVPGQIASVSQYGLTNERERFAEAFVQYVLNPAGLKKKASGLYDWVDDAMQKAIQ